MKATIPSPETLTPTTPLRLNVAVQVAFPDGSMGVSGLRNEIDRGNLPAEKIACKIYVTLAGIDMMRHACAIKKGRNSTCGDQGEKADNAAGSSSIAMPTVNDSQSAHAHLN